jgi:HlyD family secretion protein
MKTVSLTLLGLGLAGGGLALFNADAFAVATDKSVDIATYEVVRSDLEITLTETGTLMAKQSETLQPKFRGYSTINFLIPEGEEVEEGEVVCKFDTKEAQKNLDELELQLLAAQTDLKTAQTDLEVQRADNLTNVAKAQIAYDKALKDLERYRDGDAPQEVRKLDIALRDAMTTYEKAKKKYEDSLKLIELKYINQSELEEDKIAFEKAEIQRDEARLAIELHKKYVYPMTMAEKQNAVDETRRALETADKRAASQLGQRMVAVTQAEKRLKKYQDSIEQAKEDLENMVLKAPSAGIIVYGDPRQPWYRENIKIGGQLGRGHTVMTIPVLSVMQVNLGIHEADISKVKVGQRARITMDTYPGLTLVGEVTRVASIAAAGQPWQPSTDVKKFDIEVTIQNQADLKLKPGISAKVEIEVDTRKQVLYVPRQCTFLEGGKHWVNVAVGGEIVRRQVTVGLTNDAYVEIQEGLEEGSRVLLYNPNLPPPEASAEDGEGAAPAADAPAALEATTAAGS